MTLATGPLAHLVPPVWVCRERALRPIVDTRTLQAGLALSLPSFVEHMKTRGEAAYRQALEVADGVCRAREVNLEHRIRSIHVVDGGDRAFGTAIVFDDGSVYAVLHVAGLQTFSFACPCLPQVGEILAFFRDPQAASQECADPH